MTKFTVDIINKQNVSLNNNIEIYNVNYLPHKRTLIHDCGQHKLFEFPSLTIPIVIGKVSDAIAHDEKARQHEHTYCFHCDNHVEKLKTFNLNYYVMQGMGAYANKDNIMYRLNISNYICSPVICLYPTIICASTIAEVINKSLQCFWNSSFDYSDYNIICKEDSVYAENELLSNLEYYYNGHRLLQQIYHHI